LCQATEACDLDGDGDVDVVAVSPSEDATVFLSVNPLKQGGNVRAEWQTIVLDGDGGECERIVCEDVDADGWKDLVYILGKYGTTRHDASVAVLFNPGDGDISQAWRKQTIGNAYDRDPNREKNGHGVLVADVDQDGDLDILSACGANRKSGVIFWFRNPGPAKARGGSWYRYKISEDSKINYGGLQLDDVNNDGWVDLFATESHGRDCDGVVQKCPGDIYWFQHPGADPTGDWQRHTIGSQNFPHEIHVFDVDGDGQKEVWAPDCAFIGGCAQVKAKDGIKYFKKRDRSGTSWDVYRVADYPVTGRQGRFHDVDHDGDLDVMITCDHVAGCPYKYDPGGTVSLVWWENCHPRKERE